MVVTVREGTPEMNGIGAQVLVGGKPVAAVGSNDIIKRALMTIKTEHNKLALITIKAEHNKRALLTIKTEHNKRALITIKTGAQYHCLTPTPSPYSPTCLPLCSVPPHPQPFRPNNSSTHDTSDALGSE
jgi:hypothetical protein